VSAPSVADDALLAVASLNPYARVVVDAFLSGTFGGANARRRGHLGRQAAAYWALLLDGGEAIPFIMATGHPTATERRLAAFFLRYTYGLPQPQGGA
jgi:hypothetical protein